MKKIFSILVALLMSCGVFSQKTIDKPDYGLSNLPGKLTKIELTDSATIIHFYIKYYPGQWIFIPKESFIQDVNGGEKIFVTKTEGIPIAERYTMPESGEVSYKLYFPKLDNTVNKVDFGEANEGGDWSIYDIVINEKDSESLIPKVLQGNWFLTDGSNQWDYGFYANQAVVDKAVWKYKTVESKKNNYTIVLENAGKEKTIYAQIDKKEGVKFGDNKEKLATYSTEKIDNPNYKLTNDEVYTSAIFKSDSATFSGFIKGYTGRAARKTGTIHVSNVLTGNQDSHLVKIADDGSFSVKFPINHPQSIYVNILGNRSSVFVEPGKETFMVVDRDTPLFMGDCARINSDLLSFGEPYSHYEEYRKLLGKILEISPEDYKKACLDIKNNQLQIIESITKKQFISQKALQIKKLDIEYMALENILSYDMYREDFKRSKLSENNQFDSETEDFKLDKSYYDFLTPSVLNNVTAVVTNSYYIFINRLRFANIFRNNVVSSFYNLTSETAESLQKSGVTLSTDELQMAAASRKVEKNMMRTIGFFDTNRTEIQKFQTNHKEAYSKLQKDNPKIGVSVEALAAYLKTQGITLTVEENELLKKFKLSQLTKEELAIQKQYYDQYGESLKLFNEKYKENIQVIADEKEFEKLNDKLNKIFGIKEAFVYDVFTLQDKAGDLESNFTPYTDTQLKWIQGKIKNPFLSNSIVRENDRIKAKIEMNKKQTGFVVNTVKKTESDELFDSMLAKFKGKVVYVDFWATWCGPCMQGIKEIAPLKDEMKDQEVVFLYITNQSSPEKTWNNSIPNIKGEHYRVSEDEWNYLTQKFNISGIPHYVLVNKKGEVVNPELGHHSNESLKKILEKQL
ncbi:thioredoxin-like domain-containing protein [Flavobacterium sp. GSA192]|uniref:thioredoxin-like domain-containing protein n=1 Tax=Flavobacterium sp. GSA192 TaxID=2576304 RepID=UPI00112967C6|nr:thioredoxin-like domain-containing protein [Flavobacterium sp. GSA192]